MAGEAEFWDFLRVRMPKGTHYSRIESETSPGFPDVHYTLQGHSGTLELKSVSAGKASYPFARELRKSQEIWIREEIQAGGHVTLALKHGPDIYFLNGRFYPRLELMTIKEIANEAELIWKRRGSISVPGFAALLLNL